MPTLSLVMIVRNEAHGLADCLESVRPIADELVVGDTGSTDGTPDLARSLGARVIDVPWHDDFAAARNAVCRAAQGDWLLHLDADEWIAPDDAKILRLLVDADGEGADAFELGIANYCDDAHAWRWVPVAADAPYARGAAGYIRTALLRLFRNRPEFEYREAVHENVTESVVDSGGSIAVAPVLIHHYGYHGGADGEKTRRYLALCRIKVQQRPADPKAWADLAEHALAVGKTAEAEAAARSALERAPDHLGAATTLANILLNRGDLMAARNVLAPFALVPEPPPHVALALGVIAFRKGQVAEAREWLEPLVGRSPGAVQAWLALARVYDVVGDEAIAARALEAAYAAAPALGEVTARRQARDFRLAGEAAYRAGDVRQALAFFVRALECDRDDPVTHNDAGAAALALGDATRARAEFERALRLAPAFAAAAANLAALEP